MSEATHLHFRPLRDEHDYAILTEIHNAAQNAIGLDWNETVERMRELLKPSPRFDPAQDLRIIERDGQPIAYGRTWWLDRESGERTFIMSGYVHPTAQGQGVGRALLGWLEQRSSEVAAQIAVPARGTRYYHVWAEELNLRKKALLESAGYVVARYQLEMVRPNLDDIPDFQLPAHLEIRPIDPDNRALMRAIWEADAESFADHWGYSPPTEEDYQHWLKDTLTQPKRFKVAFDKATGEVAGMVLNFINEAENTRLGRKRGYTEGISTRRKYRKQGVARALICESLRMLRDMGMTEAALGADADNLTGAVSVYRTCGFEVVQRTTLFWKAF